MRGQLTIEDVSYNPYYLEWCRQTGQIPGNHFKTYEFMIWIHEQHSRFRAATGWHDSQVAEKDYIKQFIKWMEDINEKHTRRLEQSPLCRP